MIVHAAALKAAEQAIADRWERERLYSPTDPECDADAAIRGIAASPEVRKALLAEVENALIEDGFTDSVYHDASVVVDAVLAALAGPQP